MNQVEFTAIHGKQHQYVIRTLEEETTEEKKWQKVLKIR